MMLPQALLAVSQVYGRLQIFWIKLGDLGEVFLGFCRTKGVKKETI